MIVYLISGLGADEQIFRKLKWPEEVSVVFLSWLIPTSEETMATYVDRMLERVENASESAIVGMSFGGFVAHEMHRRTPFKKLILLSSIRSHRELGLAMRFFRHIPLYRIVKPSFVMRFHPIAHFFFGTNTNEEKEVLSEIIRKADPWLVDWSADQLIQWQRSERPENAVHIHGSHDRIFPIRYVHPDHVIAGGTHFMCYGRSEDVSALLSSILVALY